MNLTIPKQKPFYVKEEVKNLLIAVAELSQESPQNVLVRGLQGCGKSSLAEQFAARLQRPFCQFQVGLLTESGQLFGQQTLRNNNVIYQQFLFTDAIQIKDCVILLDEINRAENPKALNALFSVLDDRRHIWIDELQKQINVAPGVVFFATINEGAQFMGIDQLDAAIADRFFVVEMSYLPPDLETKLLHERTGMILKEVKELSSLFKMLRDKDIHISTRKAIDIAKLVKLDMSFREAFIASLSIDKDELEKALIALHLGQEEEDDKKGKEQWTEL